MINSVTIVLIVIVGVLLYLLIQGRKKMGAMQNEKKKLEDTVKKKEESIKRSDEVLKHIMEENLSNWEKMYKELNKYKREVTNEHNDVEERVKIIDSSRAKSDLFLRTCMLKEKKGSRESCKKKYCTYTDSEKQNVCHSTYKWIDSRNN
jgi:hypothetical protein